jgi:hypothetical protein
MHWENITNFNLCLFQIFYFRLRKGSVENDPTGVDFDTRRIAKNVDVDVDIANLT